MKIPIQHVPSLSVSLSLALESWKKVKKQHKAEDERAKYKKVHIIIFFRSFYVVFLVLSLFGSPLTFHNSTPQTPHRTGSSAQQHPRGKLFSFIVYVFRECLKNYCATAKKREKNSTKIGGWRGWSFEWELLENNITASHRSFRMLSLRTVLLFGLAIFQQFFFSLPPTKQQQQTHSMLIFLIRQLRCCLIPLLLPILPHSVNIITRNDSAI